MRIIALIGTTAVLALAACGEQSSEKAGSATPAEADATTNMPADGGAPAQTTYSATGEVKSVNGTAVTLAHGPVEGLGWPAMTMDFEAPSAAVAQSVKPGDKVAFSFRQDGGTYQLTEIKPANN